MHERKTANSDRFGTSEQEKHIQTVKSGQSDYYTTYKTESSQSRRRGARASVERKQQKGTQQTVYSDERLRKLDERIQKLELEFAVMKLKQSRNLGG